MAHTAVLPIGGDHFTNDLAVGLQVSTEEAEQLKLTYGNCVVTSVPSLNEVEVGGNLASGGSAPRLVRQRFLAEILEPRARELFTLLRDNLRNGGVLEALGTGCVLTGGRCKAARPAGRGRKLSAHARPHRVTRSAAAHAAGAGRSGVFRGHRHGAVHTPHAGTPRQRRDGPEAEAEVDLCRQLLVLGGALRGRRPEGSPHRFRRL